MSTFAAPEVLVPLALGVVLLAGGSWLLRRGFRPRRVGSMPHCAKCNYNLTGISSEHCPECGSILSAETVVHGEPTRARLRLVLGGAILIPAAALLALALYSVDWYQFRPSRWLISDLSGSNVSVARRAWRELMRRDEPNTSLRTQLIESCLKAQQSTGAPPVLNDMMDYLGKLLLAGQLSDVQKDTFFTQAVTLKLVVRPKVVLGDPTPYRVEHQGRGSSQPLWTRLTQPRVLLDGQVIRESVTGSSGWSGINSSGSSTRSEMFQSPGQHTLAIDNHVAVYVGNYDDADPQRNLLWERTIPLRADFEILPAEPPGYVKHLTDAALGEALRAAIIPSDFRIPAKTDRTRAALEGQLQMSNLPAPTAFEVIYRVHGKDYPGSSVSAAKGSSTTYGLSLWDHGEKAMPRTMTSVDIILRGSEKVARGTVELLEFWDGELVYKDVPVAVDAPASQATRPEVE